MDQQVEEIGWVDQALVTPRFFREKLAAEVSGPCVLSVIEGGNHVVNNLWYRYRDQTADWMAERLKG